MTDPFDKHLDNEPPCVGCDQDAPHGSNSEEEMDVDDND